METVDDLAQLASLLGLAIPRADLERWGPRVLVFLKAVGNLQTLPIADLEPAFTPTPSGIADPRGTAA